MEENVRISVESRLLLNKSANKLLFLDKHNSSNYGDYLIVLEDLKKALKIKHKIGDVEGLIITLAHLGKCYLILGEIQPANVMLMGMLSEIQKLRTPGWEKMYNYAAELISFIIYSKENSDITIDGNDIEDNDEFQMRERIKNQLIEDSANLLYILGNKYKQSDLDDLKEQYQFEMYEHGLNHVTIVTQQDKLDNYMAGLKLFSDDFAAQTAAKANQWENIGDQYRRMNQLNLATIAYESALHDINKVNIAEEEWKKDKIKWGKILKDKLTTCEGK